MLKRDSSRPVLAWPLRRRPLPDDAGYIPFLWEGKFEQGFLDEYGPAQVGLGPPFTSKDRTVYDLANNTCGSHHTQTRHTRMHPDSYGVWPFFRRLARPGMIFRVPAAWITFCAIENS